MNEQQKARIAEHIRCAGLEDRDGLSITEIADVIVGVAEHGAAERIARQSLAHGSSLTEMEKADMAKLLGRAPSSLERLALGRCIQALID